MNDLLVKFLCLFLGLSLIPLMASGQGGDADAALTASANTAKQEPPSPLGMIGWKAPRRRILQPVPPILQQSLTVSELEKTQLKDFLKQKNTKVSKLWNDFCGDIKVISADTDKLCLEFADFSGGSQFSFEINGYTDLYSNISLSKGALSVGKNSERITQIVLDLGVLDFSQINKKTPEVVDLMKIPLVNKKAEPIVLTPQETNELKLKNVAIKHKAVLNHTYVLRSIFLDNDSYIPWRRETLYAFQIVKIENNIVTIAWKRIYSKWR